MMVTFQIILGILLALSQYSTVEGAKPRHSREALPSSPSTPIQNATEINNRDLNKIVTDDPKTDLLESKIKPVNNVHSLDTFPLKFGRPDDDVSGISESRELGKDKEKHLFKASRAIDLDSSKFWSNKNNVFTIPPIPDIDKFHDTEEESFENTHRSNFFSKFELTTPKTELFDKKYKETVESVDQTIEEGYRDSKIQPEDDIEIEDDTPLKQMNDTNEDLQTKLIVKNETFDKNSIHKDIDIEQMRKVNYESSFNDTSTYMYIEETTKGEMLEPISEKISTSTNIFTRKPSFTKDSTTEKINNQILSNKIETETKEPLKLGISTTLPATTTTKKNKSEHEDNTQSVKVTHIETTTPSETSIKLKLNITDWDNQVVPVKFFTEKPNPETPDPPELTTWTSFVTDLPKITELRELVDENHNLTVRLAMESTTDDMVSTTVYPETTNIMDDTTTITSEITTQDEITEFVSESVSELYETNTEDTYFTTESITTEIIQRTSKSLNSSSSLEQTTNAHKNITNATEANTEQINVLFTTTEESESTTVTESYTIIDDNNIAKSTEQDKTTEVVWKSSAILETTATVFAETVDTSPSHKTTTEELTNATTEYSFVHIEDSGNNHTTLHPETLSPNLNYSTPYLSNEQPNIHKKMITDNLIPYDDTTPSSTNNSTVTEEGTETIPTEHSLTKDGADKGKIAAIAISSVAAVCLVLLAGLLYVMKKRQRRLNYGPRCRPVSLDDYSIDNLSVYNSVRRKGDRISKRSFGNPAFEDPTSPTHPLNFPALAKFSTNFEDIRAEYEEIPQISARTSELPEGCDSKNRYANVIPLPETRVFLKTIDGYENSDYINANYVTGPKNVRGYYIATQAPMQNTVEDFWRMIWEQQVKVVLMLTHLVENGLEKCADYLPESEVINCSRSFGDFQVILKRREVKEKYIISSLQLKNMVSNSWREVTHFWYLGWPEKGVPNEGNSLIAFLIEARSYMKTMTLDGRNGVNGVQNGSPNNEHNPVVIHCSPGTGRTGVAIACDIAIREFESTRLVDIPKIVYKIRRDRAGAVQSKEQYQFIYKVVSLYATKLTGGALENF